MLGASPAARVPARDVAAARAVDHRGRIDRVPVHVHVVRRRVAARPIPRTRRSRSRSTGRRSSCSTCGPRPRSRSCRSSRCSASCSRWRGRRNGAAVAQRLSARPTRPGDRAGGEKLVVGGILGVDDALPRRCRCCCSSWRSLHVGGQWSLASYRALGSSASTTTLFVSPWAAVRNSVEFAAIATVIALVVGGLASVAIASRPGRATAHDGRVPDAAARHVGGDGRIRIPARVPSTRRTGSRRRRCSFRSRTRSSRSRSSCGRSCPRCAASIRACGTRRRCSARGRVGCGARSISRSRARAFAVAAGFCAAVSLGEFGATLFIARPDWPTVPIAIQRFLAAARARSTSTRRWRCR